MRGYRGYDASLDDELEIEARPARRANGGASVRDARNAWEPIVCPDCGADHPDTGSVRLKRTGNGIEARCDQCNSIAAHYVAGVWSA